ncbi:DNA repair protein RecO [Bergeriella denitrificans]|uniref:DNA repair protein RecO n=1 Tax=Bergeriella denitrificans TaxID=494 RepID=A0A378UFV8_BERDE|nr:DNA repair protein RecO [Bergeriella denitrificans]STZ75599.1 DNA repair protein (recombination protein o) [Bergeriella denitrificans]
MSNHRVNHEPAFLLAATPWRESSLWLEIYSRRYGRVALLARSARKRMSELRGVLVPFVPVNLSWYGSQELKTLHRAEWLGGWPQPQGAALFSGLYVNEIMLKLTAREDPQPELYDALADILRAVCTENNHIAALRRFEWRLLSLIGHAPDLRCDSSGQAVSPEQHYRIAPQEPPHAVSDTADNAPDGLTVSGETLLQLHEGRFSDGQSLQQALHITRLLLDFHLPEGIQSRQVLRQLRQLQNS